MIEIKQEEYPSINIEKWHDDVITISQADRVPIGIENNCLCPLISHLIEMGGVDNTKEVTQEAQEYAEKTMPNDWDRTNALNISMFYTCMIMYLTSHNHLVPKKKI